ncbi:piggyBac transposable element-derived protein 4-like isoform X2 [Diabrotica virgifera virgifera]|uniref:PiggyBac transposable element-derived protein domain-containing protein n=1 Tax=Diabrotica virgifera virgifera TaxID=50390 RepID=A0ABM5KJY2_DIAVI|nr:piggyBac transposable element-derived protein 4-like isoform X2 [Diabrotica virgifera virgifera]
MISVTNQPEKSGTWSELRSRVPASRTRLPGHPNFQRFVDINEEFGKHDERYGKSQLSTSLNLENIKNEPEGEYSGSKRKKRKKTFDLTNPQDIEEVNRLFAASDEDDDDFRGESCGEESEIYSDGVEERDEGSDTEQEGADEDEDSFEKSNIFYLGKDKVTKWNRTAQKRNVPRVSDNNITQLLGVIGEAKLAKTPVECWNCLFTNDILNDIVMYTNQYIDAIKGRFSRERDVNNTDLLEIRAFVGLLYLAGAYKANRISLEELWGKNDDGIEKFSLVMSIKRFKFLMRCLSFDDLETRSSRKENDRLAPIRDIFTKFVQNCQASYYVGESVTIDEMLVAFRGSCPFRQYIPSKLSKYGIKVYALVDAKTFYSYNLEIYTGKQNEGPFCVSNKTPDVVKRLAEPLFGSGKNITANTRFTEVSLANELKERKLSYVGTIKKNRKQLPKEFIVTKNRAQYSSIFGFSDDGVTLVSYIPRKGKNILLLSTLHNDHSIDRNTGEKFKPEIITYYNATKLGVDTVDKMIASYSVTRNISRWPMVIFFAMLNIGGINSHVIHIGNRSEFLKRRVFLKQLSHELVLGQLARRSTNTIGLSLHFQRKLKRFCSPDVAPNEQNNEESQIPSKRRRCETCISETGLRRLSKYECKKCHNAICLSHAVFMCSPCYNGNE